MTLVTEEERESQELKKVCSPGVHLYTHTSLTNPLTPSLANKLSRALEHSLLGPTFTAKEHSSWLSLNNYVLTRNKEYTLSHWLSLGAHLNTYHL